VLSCAPDPLGDFAAVALLRRLDPSGEERGLLLAAVHTPDTAAQVRYRRVFVFYVAVVLREVNHVKTVQKTNSSRLRITVIVARTKPGRST